MDELVSSATLLPTQPSVPLNLNPAIPSHYLALVLLGLDMSRIPAQRPAKLTPADRISAVALAVNEELPLLYVEGVNQCYIATSPHLYTPYPQSKIKRVVKEKWGKYISILGGLTPKLLKDTVDMVQEYTKEYQEDLNRRYISITPELFWDTETASLTGSPELPVFFRLFDTPRANNHFIQIPPFTEEQISTLKKSYQDSLDYLNTHSGDLPEDYNFITLWADYNHDVYMDIMRMMASPFMRRKPFGAYMLVGLKRNGKTAVSNDLMKTMLGTANCSSIQLVQLGDYHHNSALQWTLWNAPDEEDEKPTQYATTFKTMADHGEVKVTKLYSQTPLSVDCNFMCAFPMNHHPVWTGSGAAACVERSRIIEFTHRFKADDDPQSFAERTFTADLFSRLLGPILALATYFLDRPMVWSPTMLAQQKSLEGEMDSHTTYLDHFIAFFDGFQSVKLIYDDYKIWCSAHDLPVSSMPAFKLAFGAFTNGGQKSVKIDGKVIKGYRIRQPGKKPLLADQVYTIAGGRHVGPLTLYQDPKEDLHYSIVERCEAILEEKFKDQAEEQLNKMIVAAQAVMASERVEVDSQPEPVQQKLSGVDDIFDDGV